MKKERVRNVLEQGTKDLKKADRLVRRPDIILATDKNTSQIYGLIGNLTPKDLDYLFHRDKNLDISEKEQYYRENNVKAYAWTESDDNIVQLSFKHKNGSWIKTNQKKL